MKSTGFSFAAYYGNMDTMILLLVLFLSDKNASLKDTVQSFLRFYRENRDLITMIANQPPAEYKKAEKSEDAPQTERPEKTENRPQETVGSVRILEEFLKKCAV